MIEILQREPVEVLGDPVDEGLKDLAQQTQEYFGYTLLKETVNKKETPLKKAMAELGIQPYNDKSVELYKQAMRLKAIGWSDFKKLWIECLVPAIAVGIVGCVLTNIATPILYLMGINNTFWLGLASGISIATLFSAFGLEFLCREMGWDKIRTVKWQSFNLDARYEKPIPEFALQTAVSLKAKCPQANFIVEEMLLEREGVDPSLVVKMNYEKYYLEEMLFEVVDPFLVVQMNYEKYYLEVWNEPEFDKFKLKK